ncbi:hypothetical protein VTG60DRAFT_7339 [Thermothelomyces hinnuleus]
MDEIKGITFFFFSGLLIGIHIHRTDESCAMDTMVQKFDDPRLRSNVVWIYFPMPQHDRALALGILEALQDQFNVLVRTELMGDIMIGLQPKGDAKVRCLAASAPTARGSVPR